MKKIIIAILASFIYINVNAQKLVRVFELELLEDKFIETTVEPNKYWEIKTFRPYAQNDLNKLNNNFLGFQIIYQKNEKLFAIIAGTAQIVSGNYKFKIFSANQNILKSTNQNTPIDGVLIIFEYEY